MVSQLIHFDPSSKDSLQSQLRKKLVQGILVGSIAPGSKLPSTRKLAQQLGISRNTVVLVYQTMIDERYLISRERSGIFVSDHITQGRVTSRSADIKIGTDKDISKKFKGALFTTNETSCPADWRRYEFPFIDGKYDTSLYPVREWREASNKANATKEILNWSNLQGEDDPVLIDEIRQKILPRRGIQSSEENILITVGSQQALYLVTELFVDKDSVVAVEEPGYPEMRELLQKKSAKLVYQPLDDAGLVVDDKLDDCDCVYVTPSHQTPTSITMSMQRRADLLQKAREKDFLVIEDDFEFESNFLGQPHPALKSFDQNNQVIYISCLSKVLISGLQIGFIVASSAVINELKKIRKLISRNPPIYNQRSVAYFLSLGYYDSYMMQLHKTFFERWLALREALNIYLPNAIDTGPIEGGTAYWVTGPKELDGEHLRLKAAEIGILIEPAKRYFAGTHYQENCFRMGITSIPTEKIKDGVEKLAELIHSLTDEFEEKLNNAKGKLLTNEQLQKQLSNIRLECQMVYGVPCTIDLLPDGSMRGHTGGKDNEYDVGRWWVKNGRYYRKWNLWGYGQEKSYYVVIDGNIMKWFDQNYCFVRELTVQGNIPSN